MIIVQAGLGLRIAELLALRLEDVDFLRRLCGWSGSSPKMASTAFTQNTKITPHAAIAHRSRRNACGAHLGIFTG